MSNQSMFILFKNNNNNDNNDNNNNNNSSSSSNDKYKLLRHCVLHTNADLKHFTVIV